MGTSQPKPAQTRTVIPNPKPLNPIFSKKENTVVPKPVQYKKGQIINIEPLSTFINNEGENISVSFILPISNNEILVTFTNFSIAYFSIDFETKKINQKCLKQKLFNSEITYLHLLDNKEILSCSGTSIKNYKF